ncbi:TlpA disulfide reductase family protein [Neptunitalea lumnitzerae]|uniref:Thiol:disulfide interchange protein n=1 Tax=Neptunitalea lumnitzerae TaxID=2965509 RepID=A0ABQ5MI94_9FLAO|nr:TlpA disulfide reductase family protein [Neptunitalea sp. Y10]GLB49119.1 thiol:disulfide interchange protein [Neptunitalea sp. Y10]
MKKIFAIIFAGMLCACNQNTKKEEVTNNQFEITGTLATPFEGYIYLTYADTVDSVLVKENTFHFTGKVPYTKDGHLSLKSGSEQAFFYVENSHLTLTTDYDHKDYKEGSYPFITITNIEGSKSYTIEQDFYAFYKKHESNQNFPDLLYKKLDTLTTTHPTHPFSGAILASCSFLNPVLTKQQLLKLYAKLDTTKQSNNDLYVFKRGIANLDKFSRGKSFLEFALPNTQNDTIAITYNHGKITLVDFWASYCVPCRKANPKYVALKERVQNPNFDIVSISIDEDTKLWKEAIKKDKLTWTNLLDSQKTIYNQLGAIGIPYTYVLDENGTILSINPSIDEIEKLVSTF